MVILQFLNSCGKYSWRSSNHRGLPHRIMRVRTWGVLLHSLSDLCYGKNMNLFIPNRYWLNSSTPVLLQVLYSHSHNHNNNKSTYTNKKHNRLTQIHRRLRCFGTNAFINFWVQFFDTRIERQFLKDFLNYTMLTTLQRSETSFGVLGLNSQHHGRTHLLNIMVGPQLLNFIVRPNFSPSLLDPKFNCLPQWQTTQLSVYISQSQLPTDYSSKSSNSRDHRFWAWRHTHSSPNSYLRFIMTIVIVKSFAHER